MHHYYQQLFLSEKTLRPFFQSVVARGNMLYQAASQASYSTEELTKLDADIQNYRPNQY